MTTTQTLKKIRKMVKDDRQLLLDKCKQLLNSGGIDKDDYEDNYRLPRIV